MTSGKYVFLYFQLYFTEHLMRPWFHDTNVTAEQKLAYDAVKLITTGSLSESGAEQFVALSEEYVTDSSLNISVQHGDPFGALLAYDATLVYLSLLDTFTQEGNKLKNGKEVFRRVRNTEFPGFLGPVRFDNVADREPNFAIWHYNEKKDSFDLWTEVAPYRPAGHRFVEPEAVFWRFGNIPHDRPDCGFKNEHCKSDDNPKIIAAVLTISLVALLSIIIVMYIRRKKAMEKTLKEMLWKIKYEDIQDINTANSTNSAIKRMSKHSVLSQSRRTLDKLPQYNTDGSFYVGLYNGHLVAVKRITDKPEFSRKDHILLCALRSFRHDNVNAFLGVCVDAPNFCTITRYCEKGSLDDILGNDDIKLDWSFKVSLINDLANGLQFIHSSLLGSHGGLMSSNCLVDSRWVLKISQVERQLLRKQSPKENEGEYQIYWKLLWTAPELLRMSHLPPQGTKKGDIYSIAIIMQELIFRELPFFIKYSSPKDLIENVKAAKDPPFRPELPRMISSQEKDTLRLIEMCWDEDPNNRPSIESVLALLRKINGRKLNVLDSIVMKMEKYSENLEQIVVQRNAELIDEKMKTDALLQKLLPKSVAEALKTGQSLTAEMFDSVSVYFSDIEGFTKMSSKCTPIQVVDLLNHLYSVFDSTIEKHDVYKVETIGDAYMVVGGVPQKSNMVHIKEISNMALDLLHESQNFEIKDRPDLSLKLRSGIHTGPCAAGVVGITMPRYCLFGNTINIASKMESTGKALKIQMSQQAYHALKSVSKNYIVEPRTDTQDTFWLMGKIAHREN